MASHLPGSEPGSPITTVDYHTAGEPFRIVTGGVRIPEGATVLDRRSWSQEYLDSTRALLVNEPRGHADMYGCFVTPPNDSKGHLGVVFFHKDGFSTACGHGTIALVTWAIDSGVVVPNEDDLGLGMIEVFVDAPSGRLRTEATLDSAGLVTGVRFWNVSSFVSATSVPIKTSEGSLSIDVSFGGAFYGSVDLDTTDIDLEPGSVNRLISLGREIKARFGPGQPNEAAVTHQREPRLSGMYGVIFHQETGTNPLHQKNVTVFADGEVDRSPCGSGTSARLALLHHHGRLAVGDAFLNQGIAGGIFEGRVESIGDAASEPGSQSDHGGFGRTLVETSVAGAAYRSAECSFSLDPRDPIGLGFQLR